MVFSCKPFFFTLVMLIHKHEGVSYIMMYSSVYFSTTIYILFIDVFLPLGYFGVPMRDFYKWNCFPGIFLIKLFTDGTLKSVI